jgi:cathepsin L
MRLLLLALLGLAAVQVILAAPDKNQGRFSHQTSKKWAIYKTKHVRKERRSFKTSDEEEVKYTRFLTRDTFIEDHNEKFAAGLVTEVLDHNEMSIMTREEMNSKMGLIKPDHADASKRSTGYGHIRIWTPNTTKTRPSSVNWVQRFGNNWPVRDQGYCGSCWTFSATASMESALRIANGLTSPRIDLSQQFLVDCDSKQNAVPDTYNNGCNGGWPPNAIDDVIYTVDKRINGKNGIPTDAQYPYTAATYWNATSGGTGKCSSAARTYNPYEVVYLNGQDGIMWALDQVGPVMTCVFVGSKFQSYKGGIYSEDSGVRAESMAENPYESAGTSGCACNHAVVIVGYGFDSTLNKNYWLVRNSWGATWGESGYIRMERSPTQFLNSIGSLSCRGAATIAKPTSG